nr:hypothetical protein [Sphingobium estronivorans]
MSEFDAIDPNPQFKFNLRGWAFYHFVKLLTPNLSDPKVLAETIRKDRAQGPSKPPRKLADGLDWRESAENGMRVFRARRKGAPATTLKLLYLHGGAYVLDLQAIQWNLINGLLNRHNLAALAHGSDHGGTKGRFSSASQGRAWMKANGGRDLFDTAPAEIVLPDRSNEGNAGMPEIMSAPQIPGCRRRSGRRMGSYRLQGAAIDGPDDAQHVSRVAAGKTFE